MTRTKIVCTMGPAVNNVNKIMDLMQAGMSVARLNFSHGTYEEHAEIIRMLKEARSNLKKPLAIMLDTKGPEIRLGAIENNQLYLKSGQQWCLNKEKIVGNENQACINPAFVIDQLKIGDVILFDDGYISSHVISKNENSVMVEIDNGGLIKSGKGINIPNASISLPDITEKDIADIRFGCEQDIDMIAASFVRSADHVLKIKKILAEESQSDVLIIAKIENSEGVNNFDSIVQVSDGIMIARGDLGVQVPLSQVPILQKMMIKKCCLAGKPSITATQMLESMINNPRPTRAEASDVANAIFDSTSAVMLSGETAIGKFPLETVKMMKSIIRDAEAEFDYKNFFVQTKLNSKDVPSAVTLASVTTAYNSDAKAIYVFTSKGGTARLVSRLRPSLPIVAFTFNEKCYHQMASNWGVTPILCDYYDNIDEAWSAISHHALEKGLLNHGDLVVMTAGSPFGISGTTNMMIVENVGEVLFRGIKGFGELVSGQLRIILSLDQAQQKQAKDCILLITKYDESYLNLIKESKGIILQNLMDDLVSENILMELAKEFGKPLIIRAVGTQKTLEENQIVTLDPSKAVVYKP